MGTSAFLGCGSTEEPRAFLWWMLHAGRRTRPALHVAYDLLGGARVPEGVRPELSGYWDARPVRVGNDFRTALGCRPNLLAPFFRTYGR